MSQSKAVSPTSAEVIERIFRARERHRDLVRVRKVGVTAEGRPIHAVSVTDPAAPPRDKQHVLIAAGQHGNEESGRLVALALLDYLVSRAAAARETLRRQKVVILPNLNPDGAERDSHATPAGVLPNRDHPPQGASSPEGRALEKVALALQPEVFVDLHARGYAGCSYGMVLYPATKDYTEDDFLHHQIAAEMAAAAEKVGLPQCVHPLTWSGWGGRDGDEPSTTRFAYRRFKSLVFLTECSEDNRHCEPARLRARAGLAKLKALLAWGNRRHPSLYYPGYPCQLACGMFHHGVAALGTTAAARRRSRIDIWQNAPHFTRLETETPEPADRKRVIAEYTGPALPHGAALQLRMTGRREIARVRLNARRLRPSQTTGYMTWHDGCSTFVAVAARRAVAGTYEIAVELR